MQARENPAPVEISAERYVQRMRKVNQFLCVYDRKQGSFLPRANGFT